MTPARRESTGLLLDYGGVLTTSVAESFLAWERRNGLERGQLLRMIRDAYAEPDGGLVGRLERGEISVTAFDESLSRLLVDRGHPAPAGSVTEGLFAQVRPAGRLWRLVERARAAGVRTGLLSNSWGTDDYPRGRLAELFDVQVISGEVGMRKPDPAIYELALERLGVTPGRCAFVDDLPRNVEVAQRLGVFGVVHRGDGTTVREVTGFLPGHLELGAGPRPPPAGA